MTLCCAARLHALPLLALGEEPTRAIAPSELRSGKEFVSPETRAQQEDLTVNPGMLWVEQGEKLWREAAGAEGKSCASCHGEPSSLAGVAARYPAYDAKAQRLLNLEGAHPAVPRRAPEGRAARLRIAAAAGAHRARGASVARAADARRHRWAGAAVLRGGPHALLRAAGPARSVLRAMPRAELGQAPASGEDQPGPPQRLPRLPAGVADAGLAAPPPARLLPGRARRALRLGQPGARRRSSSTSPGARKAWPIETPAVRR